MSALRRAAALGARQVRLTPVASQLPALRVPNRLSSTDEKQRDPATAAASLINLFPGSNPAQKSGSVLLFSSIAAYLLSKEIYVIDAEVFEVICLFGAYYIWYSNGKEGAIEYFKDKQNTIRNVLTQARQEHKAVVQERIAHISKLSDVVEVTKGLFGTAKEIATLEAQVYELKQKVNYTNEVKSVLDSWVRHEASVRERQQKDLAESVIAKIRKDLLDPKLQASILQQTVQDVEKVLSQAK